MAPKHKSSDAGHLDMPTRSRNVLFLREKVEVRYLIMKEKNHMPRGGKNEPSTHGSGKKEKEIHASLAATPHTARVTATVSGKCLVKTGKALHAWVEDRTSSRLHDPPSDLRSVRRPGVAQRHLTIP